VFLSEIHDEVDALRSLQHTQEGTDV
jgi:hypothetical protein